MAFAAAPTAFLIDSHWTGRQQDRLFRIEHK
jgi:hypothetical protein